MRARLGTYYSRLVCRFLRDAVGRLPGAGLELCLTFDDGPSDRTPELLEILDENSVHAIFFLVGENARRYPQHVRAIHEAGHTIGNHSLTHFDAWKSGPDEIAREFNACNDILEDLVGPLEWLRPPYGRVNKGVVRWCRQQQQGLMLWDLMPGDFEPGMTTTRLAQRMIDGCRFGSILVLHENETANRITPAALRTTLPLLKSSGWKFQLPGTDLIAHAKAA